MKISKEFSPVTIVLETKEELDVFRCIITGYIALEQAQTFSLGWLSKPQPSKTAQAAQKLDYLLAHNITKGTFVE